MKLVIDRIKYDTEKAEQIADNQFADGSNRHPGGRSQILYKTKNGRFFVEDITCWQGEHDSIEPKSEEEAQKIFERLCNTYFEFEVVFPDVEIKDA